MCSSGFERWHNCALSLCLCLNFLRTLSCSWIQEQVEERKGELWVDGVRDYIDHAEGMLKDFQDVLGSAAEKPGARGLGMPVKAVGRVFWSAVVPYGNCVCPTCVWARCIAAVICSVAHSLVCLYTIKRASLSYIIYNASIICLCSITRSHNPRSHQDRVIWWLQHNWRLPSVWCRRPG